MAETHVLTIEKASEDWFTEAYQRLRAFARRELRRSRSHTLNTTGLVHEAYLRMCANRELTFEEPAKFFSYAVTSMRHLLIDRASRRLSAKRGFGLTRVELGDQTVDPLSAQAMRALQLEAALGSLEAEDARAARVVELHFFAGVSLEQIARMLGVVRRTVDRDWRYARSFLLAHLDGLGDRGD